MVSHVEYIPCESSMWYESLHPEAVLAWDFKASQLFDVCSALILLNIQGHLHLSLDLNKSKSILNTHIISVHTMFEWDCVKIFSDNGRKPTLSVILWPLEGQNLSKVAQSWINSEH